MFQAKFHATNQRFTAEFTASERFNASGLSERISTPYTFYDGIVEVTPTNETITLNTHDKILMRNIIVNPIPNNYGLVSWNGSFLRIS